MCRGRSFFYFIIIWFCPLPFDRESESLFLSSSFSVFTTSIRQLIIINRFRCMGSGIPTGYLSTHRVHRVFCLACSTLLSLSLSRARTRCAYVSAHVCISVSNCPVRIAYVCTRVAIGQWIRILHTRDDLLCHVRFGDAITMLVSFVSLTLCMSAHIDRLVCLRTHSFAVSVCNTYTPHSHISLAVKWLTVCASRCVLSWSESETDTHTPTHRRSLILFHISSVAINKLNVSPPPQLN